MKSKLTAQMFVTVLAISGTVVLPAFAQKSSPIVGPSKAPSVVQPFKPPLPKPPSQTVATTIFQCVSQGTDFATVAQKGDRRTGPIIIWQTRAFGPEYTPQQRCEKVSTRLTQAVSQNGGSLQNLLLTTGSVNRQMVVCYVNTAGQCSSTNMLFTLKPENARSAGDVVATLVTFAKRGGGSAVYESGGAEEGVFVSLEEVVNQAFESGGTSVVSPESLQPSTSNSAPDPVLVEPNNTPAPQPSSPSGGI